MYIRQIYLLSGITEQKMMEGPVQYYDILNHNFNLHLHVQLSMYVAML